MSNKTEINFNPKSCNKNTKCPIVYLINEVIEIDSYVSDNAISDADKEYAMVRYGKIVAMMNILVKDQKCVNKDGNIVPKECNIFKTKKTINCWNYGEQAYKRIEGFTDFMVNNATFVMKSENLLKFSDKWDMSKKKFNPIGRILEVTPTAVTFNGRLLEKITAIQSQALFAIAQGIANTNNTI